MGVFADLDELLEERTRLSGEGGGEGGESWQPPEDDREHLARPTGKEEDESRRFVRGVVFYMRQARVVGVLLWNLPDRLQLARQVSVYCLPRLCRCPVLCPVLMPALCTGVGTRRVRGPERAGEAVHTVRYVLT